MSEAAANWEIMKLLATFPSSEEAHLCRAFLESRGVEAVLLDEHITQMFWHYTQAFGGVRLVVAEEDWDTAAELYGEYMAALRDGPFPVEPVRAWPLVVLASLCVGLPLLLFGRHRNGGPRP